MEPIIFHEDYIPHLCTEHLKQMYADGLSAYSLFPLEGHRWDEVLARGFTRKQVEQLRPLWHIYGSAQLNLWDRLLLARVELIGRGEQIDPMPKRSGTYGIVQDDLKNQKKILESRTCICKDAISHEKSTQTKDTAKEIGTIAAVDLFSTGGQTQKTKPEEYADSYQETAQIIANKGYGSMSAEDLRKITKILETNRENI